MKGIVPSHDLRKWFNHDPDKWDELKDRYRKELYRSEDIQKLIKLAEQKDIITFIYTSKDEEHNSTVVLEEFIEQLLS